MYGIWQFVSDWTKGIGLMEHHTVKAELGSISGHVVCAHGIRAHATPCRR